MKLLIFSFTILLSINVLANEAARSHVVQDLGLYASDYGITSFEVGSFIGVINKKYSFELSYTKPFCKGEICETYQCSTVIGLDSDAVVDFESEQDSGKCDKL